MTFLISVLNKHFYFKLLSRIAQIEGQSRNSTTDIMQSQIRNNSFSNMQTLFCKFISVDPIHIILAYNTAYDVMHIKYIYIAVIIVNYLPSFESLIVVMYI